MNKLFNRPNRIKLLGLSLITYYSLHKLSLFEQCNFRFMYVKTTVHSFKVLVERGWIAMGHPVYAFKWLALKYLANNNTYDMWFIYGYSI